MKNTRNQVQEEMRVLMRSLETTIKGLPVKLKSRCLESLDQFAIRVKNYERLSSPYEEVLNLIKEIPEDRLFTPKEIAQRIKTNIGTASRALRCIYQENPEIDIGLLFRYRYNWFYRGQDAESKYIKLPRRNTRLNDNPQIELQGINTEEITKSIKEVSNHRKERGEIEFTKEDVEDFKEQWVQSDKRAVINFVKEYIGKQGYVDIIPAKILEEYPFSHYNELTRERQININLYKTIEDSPQFYLFAERVFRGMKLREAHFLQPQEDSEEKIFYHPARLRELRKE